MEYITIENESVFEETEKRSRFISYSLSVDSSKEAREKLQKIKSSHKNAKHHVYAYIIKDEVEEKYCDDGEPSGTGGLPIFNVIKGFKLQRVMVVVVRYFGGILLGTAGLRERYSAGAKGVLNKSRTKTLTIVNEFLVECSYSQYSKVLNMISEFKGKVVKLDYIQNVVIRFYIKKEFTKEIFKKLESIMCGSEGITLLPEKYESI